jgi:hypothetical protein
MHYVSIQHYKIFIWVRGGGCHTLKCCSKKSPLFVGRNNIENDGGEALARGLNDNYHLTRLDLMRNQLSFGYRGCKGRQITIISASGGGSGSGYGGAVDTIEALLARNVSLLWRNAQPFILELCLTLVPLDLPPYVQLEIFDWLPLFAHVNHKRKIDLIINVRRCFHRIMAKRELEE